MNKIIQVMQTYTVVILIALAIPTDCFHWQWWVWDIAILIALHWRESLIEKEALEKHYFMEK